MRKTVLYLFHALLVLVPLFFSSKTDELFEFNKIILTYAIAALIFGAWLSRMAIEKRWIIKRTPFDIPIIIFVCSQIISTLFSMHARTSWFGYYSRFNGGLLSLLTYVMLYYAFISNVKKSEIRGVLNTMLYGAFATALYAIPEHFGHSFSCLMIANQFNVTCWIQDVQARIFGTFGQPNWLAAYMLMMVPVSLALLIENWKKPVAALMYGLFTISYFLTILFTASRSGFFALAVAMTLAGVAYLVLTGIRNRALFKQSLVPIITSAVILGVLFQIYGAPFTPTINALIERVQKVTGVSLPRKSLPKQVSQSQNPTEATTSAQPIVPAGTQLDVGGTESGVIRSIVWKGAIEVWKASPKNLLIGSGVETFAYSYYGQRPVEHNNVSEWDFLYNKAHNEFLNYLATTGILGLGSYLFMIAIVYIWTIRALWKHTLHNPALALAWLAAYTGLHLSNFLGFSTVMVSALFYVLPAFLLFDLDMAEEKTEKIKHRELGNTEVVFVGIAGMVTLVMLWSIVGWWRADRAYTLAKQYVQLQQALPAIQSFEKAINISPNEALFHDEYANALANIAAGLSEQREATSAAQFAQKALQEADITIQLNPVHVNFLKSRARLFIILSGLDPALLQEAVDTFTVAQKLSPTDPKLVLNQGIILDQLGHHEEALALVRKAIELKPDYGSAINRLAEMEKIATRSGKKTDEATPRDTMPVQ